MTQKCGISSSAFFDLKQLAWLLLGLAITIWPADMLAKPKPHADDIKISGPLTYEKFANTVRCGTPDRGCALVRWKKRPVTIALNKRGCHKKNGICTRLHLMSAVLRYAVREIDRASARIELKILPVNARADITIFMGNKAVKTWRGYSDPTNNGEASVWSRGRTIQSGQIRISNYLTGSKLLSVMLEEVVQSLGLFYDVDHKDAPEFQTIFSAKDIFGREPVRLMGWDQLLLRSVYGVGAVDPSLINLPVPRSSAIAMRVKTNRDLLSLD